MRIIERTGPDTAVSYGVGEGILFRFLVFVGAAPFVAVAIIFYLAVVSFAMVLMTLLAINGILFHKLTGRDARIWVPGSAKGTAIEYWMERKGWIRLPQRISRRGF
jgi:hypothetical protein